MNSKINVLSVHEVVLLDMPVTIAVGVFVTIALKSAHQVMTFHFLDVVLFAINAIDT